MIRNNSRAEDSAQQSSLTHHSIPKLAQLLLGHADCLKDCDSLIEAIELRLEAEDIYQKNISKVSQKFASVKSTSPFSVLTAQLCRVHSERAFQVSHFREEMKSDLQQLKKNVKEIAADIDNKSKEYKKIEKDFKVALEKLDKSKWKALQGQKELDEKIILNEIGKLNSEASENEKRKLLETSAKLLSEQKDIAASYSSAVHSFSSNIDAYNQTLPNILKQITDVSNRLKGDYYDFLKKYTIHEVSLLRNIQYDVDNTIRRIEQEEAKTILDPLSDPIPAYTQPKDQDSWDQVRIEIVLDVNHTIPEAAKSTNGVITAQQLIAAISQSVSAGDVNASATLLNDTLLPQYSVYKSAIHQWIESYRLSNKFKFEDPEFEVLAHLFKSLVEESYKQKDMEGIQRYMLFGITYYKQDPNTKEKKYLIEGIRSYKPLTNPEFWRFYCYFSLKFTLCNYRAQIQANSQQKTNTAENYLHEKNSVYSTLLTCASNMVQFGMEKHTIKNFIAKAAKSYPLGESLIGEILKFIENQHNSFEIKRGTSDTPTRVLRIGK